MSETRRLWVVSVVLAVMTAALFSKAVGYGFIQFDDDAYVYENPHIRDGLTVEGIRWAFTADLFYNSPNLDFWQPVTVFTRLVDCELFGMSPAGHHAVNLLFHIVNVILLFLLFCRMTGAIGPSAFAAALFAIHPLRVESVVWVTERKDVVSMLFWILTAWAYARYTEHPGARRYSLVVVCMALGLMSKPIVMTLPIVLLLLDYWPLRRIGFAAGVAGAWKRALVEKIPLGALSLISAAITLNIQPDAVAYDTTAHRVSNALVYYIWYIWKFVWPLDLAIFYPQPEHLYSIVAVTAAAMVLIGVTVYASMNARRHPFLPVGLLWFLVTLLPVIGMGGGARANRYTYVSHIGLSILAAWGIPSLLSRVRAGRRLMTVGACLILSALAICTVREIRLWENTATLFQHTLRVTGPNWMANHVMAKLRLKEGRAAEAMDYYREAAKSNPGFFARVHRDLGNEMLAKGNVDQAREHFTEALRINPDDPDARAALDMLGGRKP